MLGLPLLTSIVAMVKYVLHFMEMVLLIRVRLVFHSYCQTEIRGQLLEAQADNPKDARVCDVTLF